MLKHCSRRHKQGLPFLQDLPPDRDEPMVKAYWCRNCTAGFVVREQAVQHMKQDDYPCHWAWMRPGYLHGRVKDCDDLCHCQESFDYISEDEE